MLGPACFATTSTSSMMPLRRRVALAAEVEAPASLESSRRRLLVAVETLEREQNAAPSAGRSPLLVGSRPGASDVCSLAQPVGAVAWGLIAYALVYPGINAVHHLSVSRIPAFGVPCPTTIFTAGLLMLANPRSWRLSILPEVWSVVGGSAAILLDVRGDTRSRSPASHWRCSHCRKGLDASHDFTEPTLTRRVSSRELAGLPPEAR